MSGRIGDQDPIRQPGIEQPEDVAQSAAAEGFFVSQAGEGAPSVPPNVQMAVKHFLKEGTEEGAWKDPKSDIYYEAISKPSSTLPKGAEGKANLVTIEAFKGKPTKGAKPTSTSQFLVTNHWDKGHNFMVFDVYNKSGTHQYSDMTTQSLVNVPNNLGELASMDPKLHHEILVGIAMKIMQESRKHDKMFSQAQRQSQ